MRNIEFRDRFNNSKEYIGTRIIVSLDKKTFEGRISLDRQDHPYLTFNVLGIAKTKIVSTNLEDIHKEASQLIQDKLEKRISDLNSILELLRLEEVVVTSKDIKYL